MASAAEPKKEKKRPREEPAVAAAGADAKPKAKRVKSDAAAAPTAAAAEPVPKKAKAKKSTIGAAEAAAEPAAAAGDASKPSPAPKKAKKGKAAEPAPAAAGTEPAAAEDPLSLDNFALSPSIVAALRAKGVASLFPIQAQTFAHVLAGFDVVGRARTGQGKTLAFVLPILECLARDGLQGGRQRRPPAVIVLAPTRELAKQVEADFSTYGAVLELETTCVYGGAPMSTQEGVLRRGVDVVVGTPGRVKDFVERGTLDLSSLRFRVLDEADEMLNIGFKEDIEFILNSGAKAVSTDDSGRSGCQTLLFSATLPHWVADVARTFLHASRKTVDLVGSSTMKASSSVKHLLIHCQWTERVSIITDFCRTRAPIGSEGRVIVFVDTKKDAQEVCEHLQASLASHGARALHGDIPQATREKTLAEFRSGKFAVLVATDVAARGLDINNVVLVVQCEPPRDPETYIHRSGRTGRAGATGTSITFCTPKHVGSVAAIEAKAGFRFERIGAPQQKDMVGPSAALAADAVRAVSAEAAKLFRPAADELLASVGGEEPLEAATQLLSAALAKIAGVSEVVHRSLLSGHAGACTLSFRLTDASAPDIQTPSAVWAWLRQCLPESALSEVKRMSVTADSRGAAFDVPSQLISQFLDAAAKAASGAKASLEVAEQLPELQQSFVPPQGGFAPGRGYGRGAGGFGRGFAGRGRATGFSTGGRGGRGGGRGRW